MPQAIILSGGLAGGGLGIRYGWTLGPTEGKGPIASRPGLDMRDITRNDLAPLFPTFEHWDVDINGLPVDWAAAPIGCEV